MITIFSGHQNHSTCCDQEFLCWLVGGVIEDEMQITEFKESYDVGEKLFAKLTEIFQKPLKEKLQKQKHTTIVNLFVQGLMLQALHQVWALIL